MLTEVHLRCAILQCNVMEWTRSRLFMQVLSKLFNRIKIGVQRYPALRSFRRRSHIRFPAVHFNPLIPLSSTFPCILYHKMSDRSFPESDAYREASRPTLPSVRELFPGRSSFRSSPHSCDLTLAFRIISYSKTFRNTSFFLGEFQRPGKPRPILCTAHEPVRRCAIRARLAG